VRAVVLGAGVTGLAAAHHLQELRPDAEVVVLEATDRAGGKVRSSPFAGLPAVDAAADGFLARVPEATQLCRRLGLGDQLVSPTGGGAFVFRGGRLHRYPPGLVLGVPTDLDALSRSGIVSPEAVARAARDLDPELGRSPTGTATGAATGADESVGALVRRRLGDEVFEALVAPLVAGVNAGDADRLSLAAGAPILAAAVRHQPSLIAGLRAAQAGSVATGPVFHGLRSGTQALTDALVGAVRSRGGRVELSTPATSLERVAPHRHRVGTPAGALDADAVVVATPAPAAARLLAVLAPDVAAGLAEVAYASVVLVALALPRDRVDLDLDGTGFLVPAPEGLLLTACTWSSSKWVHLDRGDQVLLRASAGRAHDTRALELDDASLVERLRGDLATTMGLAADVPARVRVTRWAEALPQFRPGHLDRVAAWHAEVAGEHPGLAVAGAALEGLGIPACVRQGWAAAERLAATTPT
jgi:oxygen-dependent protoporphyrinogen oxidase